MDIHYAVILAVLTFATQLAQVTSHGRLMNPPARNTMWRVGFPCPVNYNDNELFCGGYIAQQVNNSGKCGLCGDNWSDLIPRPHETGGKYGIALVTRRYYSGQVISVVIELTSNHLGYFIFKICSIVHYSRECEDEKWMDRNIIPVLYPNGTLARRYYIETREKKATIELNLLLTSGYNCTRCCFQWTYVTGNSVGICEDGSEALGCGPQETFRNCADVAIYPMPYNYSPKTRGLYPLSYHYSPKTRGLTMDPRLTSTSRGNPNRLYYRDTSRYGAPMVALSVRFQRCCAVHAGYNITSSGYSATTPGQDEACQSRCLKYPPDCPTNLCKCVVDVRARDEFRKTQEMADQWCLDKCNCYPANDCDETKCEIFYTKTTA